MANQAATAFGGNMKVFFLEISFLNFLFLIYFLITFTIIRSYSVGLKY